MTKIERLHVTLTEKLGEMLEHTEDPRVLKEVREFLKENNVTADTIGETSTTTLDEAIDLPDLDVENYRLVNNG